MWNANYYFELPLNKLYFSISNQNIEIILRWAIHPPVGKQWYIYFGLSSYSFIVISFIFWITIEFYISLVLEILFIVYKILSVNRSCQNVTVTEPSMVNRVDIFQFLCDFVVLRCYVVYSGEFFGTAFLNES